MANQELYNGEAPLDYNARKGVAHAANTFIPSNGAIGSLASGLIGDTDSRGVINNLFGLPNKDKPEATPTEILTKLFGGFSSRYNPEQEARNEQFSHQDDVKKQMQYLKETGQAIPRSMKKEAYKKIPLPADYRN